MSKLTDAYTDVVTAIEDWIYVIQKAAEDTSDPTTQLSYSMMAIQLLMTVEVTMNMTKTSGELEETLVALGLKPRTTDTSSLDALWGNEEPT